MPPPDVAGRDALIERATAVLDRIRSQRSGRGIILYRLTGVGKTGLLATSG